VFSTGLSDWRQLWTHSTIFTLRATIVRSPALRSVSQESQ
jgi:hypothetical protein